ncbi:EVE domain-containing protein [Ruegeria arenilitoris]|uniref:EVE domain-containing protein n=1 Tax=Ruegeria arenilitoris TaxID=1173585 RepID=UPI001479B406|nr:EVE domain-containing protein [Ruegeria arenilitoris]
MNTWIFQTNPDHYDVDSLLASPIRIILFTARQGASRMMPGDTVYLWRSKGKSGAVSGIIAKGRLLDTPSMRVDDSEGSQFWINPAEAKEPGMRIKLQIEEVANKKEIIQREWLTQDPVLSDLTILKMANSSNYSVQGEHLERINSLWAHTGVAWTRAESLAALHTYQKTYGGKLSRLPGSPIAETSALIGRAIGGVYNKVLNFRHLDPRDQRAGLSGAGEVDSQVWNEFYDVSSGEIDTDALELEYQRLWEKPALQEHTSFNTVSETEVANTKGSYRPGPAPRPGEYTTIVEKADAYLVYVLELSNKKAVKVGMSSDPNSRLSDYNHKIIPEITGLTWKLAFTHQFKSVEDAVAVEQKVIKKFSQMQLPSNGEVLKGVSAMDVQLEVIKAARAQEAVPS